MTGTMAVVGGRYHSSPSSSTSQYLKLLEMRKKRKTYILCACSWCPVPVPSPSLLHPISTPRAVARSGSWGACHGGGPRHPVGAVMVGVFAACLSLVVVLWWSRRPPLCSSPFCPTGMARGRGGWCCVAWVSCRRGPGPSPCRFCRPGRSHGHGTDPCRCYLGLDLVVVLSFLVQVVVITLRHLVSSNKMKREKNLRTFCLRRLGPSHHSFQSS
jgi:hypothetical protein